MGFALVRTRGALAHLLAIGLALGFWAVTDSRSQVRSESGDEAFIRKLSGAARAAEVDRTKLARLFSTVAATLEGNKGNVQALQHRISPREPTLDSVGPILSAIYASYSEDVSKFRQATGLLEQTPQSTLRFHRSMAHGQRTCWRLQRYLGTLETYGARSGDLMTVVSSSESCARFHEAVFLPAVQAIVSEALRDRGAKSRELRELREEIAALEELIDDLAEIDRSD